MVRSIFEEIVDNKRSVLEMTKKEIPLSLLRSKTPSAPGKSLIDALRECETGIIAEVKKASPSRGIIVRDFDPVRIACDYELAGAQAVSVLTEEKYFLGSLSYLKSISEKIKLPVLRKDFIFDPYQVYESKHNGADAILLIVKCLSDSELSGLRQLAESLGMEALIEVHDESELERAKKCGSRLIGINNRDLDDFSVDIARSVRLKKIAGDDCVVVSESGIRTREDIERLKAAGIKSFLVGEGIISRPDISLALKELLGIA